MLVVIGFLSVLLTCLLIFIGLILLSTRQKGSDGTTGNLRSSEDEVKDFWQHLGLVDNSPNLIRAVVAGNENTGPIVRYIANLVDAGLKCDPANGEITSLAPGEDPYKDEGSFGRFVRVTFGKRVYGFPFIRSIRPLTIDRVVKKDTLANATEKSTPLRASFVKRYGLYREILRPTRHEDVDTADGVRFTVTSSSLIVVNNARPAFTVYIDSLLQTISEIVSGFISTKIIRMSWEDYKKRGENGHKFDSIELAELNALLRPLGVKVEQITMNDPELNPAIQAAMEARRKAGETANARREEGAGERDYKISVGEGEAKVIERIAKAKAKRFEELVEFYKSNGVPNTDAVDKANAMISAEFNADAISKLTGTYVAGGAGVQLGVFGGEKR